MRVGVLVSGAGTNLGRLLETVHGQAGIEVVAVASSRPGVRALERAEEAGVEGAVFPLEDYADREARDAAIGDWLEERGVGLVVLAGYMQLLTPPFIERFRHRILNVHPALLPAFAGVRAIEQAVDYGVKVFGVTVHYVDEGVDSGPIILQASVPIEDASDAEAVHDRLREIEHELLPEAVRLFARGALSFDPDNPRRVRIAR